MTVGSFLNKHSTICGFIATGAVAAAAGYLTHWALLIVLSIAFAGISVFPRLFYGAAARRALDEAEMRITEPTRLLSLRATITLACIAVALCVIVFGMEYAAEQYKMRTHPHHWYAVHLDVPYPGHRTSPSAITITGADGPYATQNACEQFLKTQTSEHSEAIACRQMTDADAATASR